jgi:hypothetical protein
MVRCGEVCEVYVNQGREDGFIYLRAQALIRAQARLDPKS